MKFPFVVVPELSDAQLRRYEQHFNSQKSGWHRKWTESIWRRHQHPSNASLSGWRNEGDARRRIIHFYDQYGVRGRQFVLEKAYLSLHLTLPEDELAEYRQCLAEGLNHGQWRSTSSSARREVWSRGDLVLWCERFDLHPEDAQRGKKMPAGYQHLEIHLQTRDYQVPDGLATRPWRWFYEVGMRDILPAGRPQYCAPEEILPYLPAQLELGCGPSTEARVPHLSNLHRIYGVSRPDFSFIFRAADDVLLNLCTDPECAYQGMTAIYKACMLAEPTPFYKHLRELWHRGDFVGSVITNNFDCLCADVGLPETSLRRYDKEAYFPLYRDNQNHDLLFHPESRSLLVIGVHADRRMAQRRARELGLKIIYIDPERYVAPDGTAIPYPVESPQDEDLFIRMTAGEAMPRLYQALAGHAPARIPTPANA